MSIKIENIRVNGIEAAIRGMRNPLNSWAKSDTTVSKDGKVEIGFSDMDLALRLIKAGTEHRKFIRKGIAAVSAAAKYY